MLTSELVVRAERRYVQTLRRLSEAEDWQYHMAPKSRDNAINGIERIASLRGELKAFKDIFGFSATEISRMERTAGYKTLDEKYGL